VFPAVHARRAIAADDAWELGLAEHLRARCSIFEIEAFYDRCGQDHGELAERMRYLDARDLEIGDCVGIGPGARVLGAEHSGRPVDRPVIETDQESRPVRIESGADIGTGR
jgi:acetyltransferase-like isoleucine patch superfamily enzyme